MHNHFGSFSRPLIRGRLWGSASNYLRGNQSHDGMVAIPKEPVLFPVVQINRRVSMKLLLTAFDPFGGECLNPAQEAVKLVREQVKDVSVVKCFVPTVFGRSVEIVADAIAAHHPDAVLCIGQAGGRAALTLERVAINIDDAPIPDNEGNQPVDTAIFADGENAYFTTLPVKVMAAAIREAGIPAGISYTAGTFVCNHLMYGVLYTLEKDYPGVRGGFMHVPYIPDQVIGKKELPSMPLADIVKGIETAIAAIGENETDISVSEGKTH